MKAITVNPIVTAYFRAADEAPESSDETARSPAHTGESPSSLEAVMALLTEAGMMPERPRPLLEGTGADPDAAGLTRLRRLMAYVRDTHETAHVTRGRELAFLANTLLAGCSVQSRPFTPQEASDAAASICNLGLEYWPARWPGGTSPGAVVPGLLEKSPRRHGNYARAGVSRRDVSRLPRVADHPRDRIDVGPSDDDQAQSAGMGNGGCDGRACRRHRRRSGAASIRRRHDRQSDHRRRRRVGRVGHTPR